jgi:hypothetical protein
MSITSIMHTLRTRVARRLAWSLFALVVALGLGLLPLVVAVTRAASAPGTPFPPAAVAALQLSGLDWLGLLLRLVVAWAFAALGALIVARSPAHAIGWLFCAVGLAFVVEEFAGFYAVYALFVAPGVLPWGLAAGWLQHWIWLSYPALLAVFVPLRFPTGRLVSPRWRLAWWLAVGVTVAVALLLALAPIPLGNHLDGFDVPNPLGVAGLPATPPTPFSALLVLFPASVLLAATSLVVRLRHARGVERQQIKWYAYLSILLALLYVAQGVVQNILGISSPFVDVAYALGIGLGLIGLPLTTGLSILRYRLFDIDLIIRLTLVYGTLTATLAAVYVALVVGAQAVVQGLTGEQGQQPVVIVASTLLVAALVMPLRRSVQTVIDRRFYRRRVDAERTLAAFGQALRQEVELERLGERVLAVVEETMQPAHASLWLRIPLRHDARRLRPGAPGLTPTAHPGSCEASSGAESVAPARGAEAHT